MLGDFSVPALQRYPGMLLQRAFFQEDAHSHFVHSVKVFSHRTFPEHLIGHRGNPHCLAHSPDLRPMYFSSMLFSDFTDHNE